MTRAVALVVLTTCFVGCFSRPDPPTGTSSDGGIVDGLQSDGTAFAGANVMFVTSVSVMVDTLGGIAGADAICRTRAAAAGLPGTFKAWLSSTFAESAIGRLGGASGWVRRDRSLFAASLADLILGHILVPPRLDENGADVDPMPVITATLPSGQASQADCTGLSGGTFEGISTGLTTTTTNDWTEESITPCIASARLYCFQVDSTTPLTIVPASGRIAFLSDPWLPTGGLPGANNKCNESAATNPAYASKQFTALLATEGEAAFARLGAGPWVRPDGVAFVGSTVELLSDALPTSLNVDATGHYVANTDAWTGADTPGIAAGNQNLTCNDWTSGNGTSTGKVGDVVHADAKWFSSGTPACNVPRPLYCFEQ